MHVAVSRSGGVAGMVRRGAVDFPLRSGSAGDASGEWADLYRAARAELAAAPAPGHRPSRVRDAFQWTIVLGRERHVLADSELTGAARELAEKVLRSGLPDA